MIISNRKLSIASVASLFALVGISSMSTGCSAASADETVSARLVVIDRSQSALSAGSITSIDGTYSAACGGHESGTDTWSLTAGGVGLAVAKNDTNCVLTIANIVAGGNTYAGTPAIGLTTTDTWKATSSVFASDGQPSFYGNAKISALTFAASFQISVLVSDSPSATPSNKAAQFGTVNGSVSSETVPAPNNTISMDSFAVEKDAENFVLSSSGFAQLAVNGTSPVAGQDYAVHLGSLSGASTIQAITSAFEGAAAAGTLASLDPALQVPAASFSLDGLDLDSAPVRTVIVRNLSNGVASYQLFTITFTP